MDGTQRGEVEAGGGGGGFAGTCACLVVNLPAQQRRCSRAGGKVRHNPLSGNHFGDGEMEEDASANGRDGVEDTQPTSLVVNAAFAPHAASLQQAAPSPKSGLTLPDTAPDITTDLDVQLHLSDEGDKGESTADPQLQLQQSGETTNIGV